MEVEDTNRGPMTVCQKILVQHAIGLSAPFAKIGSVIRIAPAWLLSSEVSWFGMNKSYDRMGRPGIKRPDRFWLAGDHVVDPRVNDRPYERSLIEACDRIAEEISLGDNYAGHNTTIMHTEFYRSRCEPGMLVIGADSHTSSAGALGALAIGVGSTDLVMQLITGETYLEVPEITRIRFINRPPTGIGGKDAILGVMRLLKRNTVAAGRLVEYVGDGLKYLSCDARFAIANMTTEFGGIGACVVPDGTTLQYIGSRRDPKYKSNSLYFQPDPDAVYADSYDIDLSRVEHFVALYPSPDNVVPVNEAKTALAKLDGVFIGACTTTEEDLILAALVLQEAMKAGMKQSANGLRRMTPGSTSIVTRLGKLGLLSVYEAAGFQIGAPGCSYCVGMGVDKAGKGETWLSSQNRNYRDRMGPGSIGNIASAATVAISSLSMSLQDPQPIIDRINQQGYDLLRGYSADSLLSTPAFIEPSLQPSLVEKMETTKQDLNDNRKSALPDFISGTIQRFGDNMDTDSIIPTEKCHSHLTQEQVARGAFCYTRPEFYDRAQAGATVVVAEKSFGCGSSREQAPKALMWAGIQLLIARSFAFIFQRNCVNTGLLGIRIQDDDFYEIAKEGVRIEIDIANRIVRYGRKAWPFRLEAIQDHILANGGLISTYEKYGQRLLAELQALTVRSNRKTADPSSYRLQSASALEW